MLNSDEFSGTAASSRSPYWGIRGVQGYLLGRPAHAPRANANFDRRTMLLAEVSDPAGPVPFRRRYAARTSYRALGEPQWPGAGIARFRPSRSSHCVDDSIGR
jgi:hypothetical protein